MSQVIVTSDALEKKRDASRAQEKSIVREAMFERWKRNDISGRDPIAAAFGFAAAPILLLWSLLTALIVVMLGVIRLVFRGFGYLIGGSDSVGGRRIR